MDFLTMGEKVRKLREQLDLNQEDLQTEKVSRGLISMIETGKRDVSYATAIKLAEKFNQKADKLNIILNVDADYLMRSPNEDAELYCLGQLKNDEISQSKIDEILQLSEEYDLIRIRAKIYFKMGQINEEKKNYEDACKNYEDAIKIYKTMGKDKELGQIYLRMGISKGKNLQHEVAIVYFNLSQYYSFVYDDKKIQQSSLYNLANAYFYSNKIDLALETIEKYLTISDESDPFYNFGFNTKANCYELRGDYDRAIETYKDLICKISDKVTPILGYVYNNLGLNYCHKDDFKESLKYFEMAEKFRSELDKVNLGVTLIEKSNVFLKQNLYTDAIKTIDEGLNYAIEYNDMEYLIKGYYTLADIYDKLSNWVNLENVYMKLVELLKINNDKNNLKSIYDKMALMYLRQDKPSLCQEYLLLSNDLN
ncbi:Tetratricopeptide repeat-containing protein [Clostridium acidisoli DSM 12555]|uniref:Tetratricopeptide repeat-containing protein n=2 Tax=Clostridium TaxID=1485 RepID=A0A1W1XHJ7_9CLOT|nr:Tetratricopeptide repeat-containing protein [Clostridium acidisoli DSM 12555]